jgi:hypothetical protein
MDVADRINLTGAGIRDGRPQDEGRKHDFWRSKPKLVPVGDLAGPAFVEDARAAGVLRRVDR